MIVGYTSYGNYEIAQSSIYGVGLLAKRIQPAEFRQVFPDVLRIISEFLGKERIDQKGSSNY